MTTFGVLVALVLLILGVNYLMKKNKEKKDATDPTGAGGRPRDEGPVQPK